jgi:hypothetical protein
MIKRNPKQEKRFAALASKMGLTIQDSESICRAAQETWNYIAYDIFQCNDGEDMRQSEVIDIVMDADYITSNARRTLTEPAYLVLRSYQHSDTVAKLLKEFEFVFKYYGM